MHDTLTPIGGLVPLVNMMLNTVYGGVGAGFCEHYYVCDYRSLYIWIDGWTDTGIFR
ncbi:potassium-transporting ATPase subunit KdpA [Bacillus pacificus]